MLVAVPWKWDLITETGQLPAWELGDQQVRLPGLRGRFNGVHGRTGLAYATRVPGVIPDGLAWPLQATPKRNASLRHQDLVDDVDDAVGLHDVAGGDLGLVALCVLHPQVLARLHHNERFALDSRERRVASAITSFRS